LNIAEFLRSTLSALHAQFDEAVQDLSVEQLHWRPLDKGNHVAFIVWHYVRTDDNVIQFVLQDRKPTVWLEGGWDQKLGLDRVAQGTGWTTEQAIALRLPSAEDWLEYQRAVWQASEAYLASVSDSELERTVRVAGFGEIPMRQAITTILVTHGFTHLGEIHHIRGLLGLKATPL
jgi:hypothetical protein